MSATLRRTLCAHFCAGRHIKLNFVGTVILLREVVYKDFRTFIKAPRTFLINEATKTRRLEPYFIVWMEWLVHLHLCISNFSKLGNMIFQFKNMCEKKSESGQKENNTLCTIIM